MKEQHTAMNSPAVIVAVVATLAAGAAYVVACEHRPMPTPSKTRLASRPGAPATAFTPPHSALTAHSPARPAPEARATCARDDHFPASFALPEASAAAEVGLVPTKRELLVLADSGNGGAGLAWAIPDGPARAVNLPLDAAASDDIEGAAWSDGHLYTLTSSGAVRRFSPDGQGGLRRDQDAYRLGPPPSSCADLRDGNCGRNYEGLCLRGAPRPPHCAGYAASKTEGVLYCLAFDGGRLVIDPTRRTVRLALPRHALSDCAFGAEGGPASGTLVVTTNIYGGSSTYVVDEASGTLAHLAIPSTLTNEAVALDRDGALYVFQDANTSTSASLRMTCRGW